MTKTTILAFSVVLVLVIGIVSAEQAFAPPGGQAKEKVEPLSQIITEDLPQLNVDQVRIATSDGPFTVDVCITNVLNSGGAFYELRRNGVLAYKSGQIEGQRGECEKIGGNPGDILQFDFKQPGTQLIATMTLMTTPSSEANIGTP